MGYCVGEGVPCPPGLASANGYTPCDCKYKIFSLKSLKFVLPLQNLFYFKALIAEVKIQIPNFDLIKYNFTMKRHSEQNKIKFYSTLLYLEILTIQKKQFLGLQRKEILLTEKSDRI